MTGRRRSFRLFPAPRRFRRLAVAALIVDLACAAPSGGPPPSGAAGEQEGAAPTLRPWPDEVPAVELAPYMAELQQLTHKLALSVGASNPRLAAFYAYESIELLGEIQRDVPVYDGQPVAMLIDRLALPPMRGIAARAAKGSVDRLRTDLDGVIASCNECHAATLHSFIRITDGIDHNPFNQDFTP